MHKETQLETALQQLEARIAEGQEFPDACWAVFIRFNGFSYEDLQKAYDESQSKR